jgi:glycerate-2-kinase
MIKNKKQIFTTKLRKKAIQIIESGISSVEPGNIVKKHIKFDLSEKILKIQNKKYRIKGRIFIIGAGKASASMAKEIEKIIPIKYIKTGIIACNQKVSLKKIRIIKTGHPYPNKYSVIVSKKILELREKHTINKNDLIICLVSGGGSSLLSLPLEKISLTELIQTNKLLVNSGADIREINTVRKRISKIKGGKLSEFFYPAKIISLIISDTPSPGLTASGLTYPDSSTNLQALKIIKKYRINNIPKNVLKVLNQKTNNKKTLNTHNHVLADSHTALKQMRNKAKKIGFS